MNNQGIIKKLSTITIALFFVLTMNASAFGQLYDSFNDGDFTTNPVFNGTNASWTIVANSDAATGAPGSNTVRLAAPAVAGTEYLSSQISNFGTTQEWGVFIGRRAQAFTGANQQYFWLYANEAVLTNTTVDGYRIAIGDDSGGDNIRLEYIVNGALSATVITSAGTITNSLTDIGFLLRVTRSSTGTFEIFTSTLPTANGTGAIATDTPNAVNANVSQGTGTENSLIPAANGFIGLAALHSTGANAIVAAEFDQIFFTGASPTAAEAEVGGRVTQPNGRGVSGVRITMTDFQGNARVAITNPFGYFSFMEVESGQTYVFSALHRRYQFDQPTQVQFVGGDSDGVNFIASGRIINLSFVFNK